MRTSLYSILCIVIRLGAVFLAFGMLPHVVALLLGGEQKLSLEQIAWTCLLVLPVLLIAFLLWLYPGVLARIASGRSSQQVFDVALDARQVQWIALSVLGMYFVMTGLIGFCGYAFQRFIMSAVMDSISNEAQTRQMVSDLVYWMVQTLLGLSLALGAKGLSGILHRLRYGDTVIHTEDSQS